ncbi:MAG: glycerol acyltransferase [Anaerolineae bacterium]|nr:glycerol acyltransferase [Anaerolineae bacterium]
MADYPLYPTEMRFTAAVAQNALDMTKAFKLERLHGLLGRAFAGPARQITETVFQYDRLVGSEGLALSSAWLLDQFAASVQVEGVLPPSDGPLLIVSNHPGMVDAMAIFAQVPRHDLRIIAAERPVLRLLPHIQPYLLFVPDDPQKRLAVIRSAAGHLRAGGALLNFPGGQIEPDPALHPDAASCLDRWSDSLNLLARLVPDLSVLPVAVSGVISPRALRHPLARLYRTAKQREWVAATLQVIQPRYRDTQVWVRFGEPIRASSSPTPQVIDQMRILIRRAAPGQG